MIKEYEYLHGVVFTRLCSNFEVDVFIKPYNKQGYSSFVLNNRAGLYIKYSGKRLAPWRFTFLKTHQDEILEMYKELGEVFIALVCKLDGVAVLNFSEFKAILNDTSKSHEWLSVTRKRNTMYSVAASDGKLDFKISKMSCPNKIIPYLK